MWLKDRQPAVTIKREEASEEVPKRVVNYYPFFQLISNMSTPTPKVEMPATPVLSPSTETSLEDVDTLALKKIDLNNNNVPLPILPTDIDHNSDDVLADATNLAPATTTNGGGNLNHDNPPYWAVTLSNAALLVADKLDKMESVTKIALEHSCSAKDGTVKRRVELELMCDTRSQLQLQRTPSL
jgi:hypothetical protein